MNSLVIFVNGYTRGCRPLKPYWMEKGTQFLDGAVAYFGNSPGFYFVNGRGPWYSTAKMRFRAGSSYAASRLEEFRSYDRICFVAHSMGCAFAEGMVSVLHEKGFSVAEIVHLSVADARSIKIPAETKYIPRIQLEMQGDRTLTRKRRLGSGPQVSVPGVNAYGLVLTDVYRMHPRVSPKDQQKWDFHYDTKTYGIVWDYIRELKALHLEKSTDGIYRLSNKENDPAIFLELLWEGKLLKPVPGKKGLMYAG